ncbi:MAG: rRNA maturation RNase YbeY [Acidimicrobiales bacterium]|nr:rRNA maturation RNase YbeY [Acidimicrobiales bacterium]MDP6298498.1 rRNA maturation RNase YbeY [Acidimicrobiales bacterium]HJM27486.1 rRNA maturation RNase YbeY [Acidimicrobiales bacterium]HJM97622.1 rRNA maturation RNase YbeY [Acidimicrobiales bacterium]
MTVFAGTEIPSTHPESGIDVERWKELAIAALKAENAPDGELNLLFVDEEKMSILNATHLGKKKPTDVLAFPIDAENLTNNKLPQLLGDVVICPAVARENAKTQNKDFGEEIALLVFHGILHILGYDHARSDESEIMKTREKQLLSDLYMP